MFKTSSDRKQIFRTRRAFLAASLLSTMFLLSGCLTPALNFVAPEQPESWPAKYEAQMEVVDAASLQAWWQRFEDPVLNKLVETALQNSPDRQEAKARILEARGNWRSAKGRLFPLFTAGGQAGRQDLSLASTDDFYDAAFDASYEIDIFGRNRNQSSAAKSFLQSSEAEYQAVTLSLIAETARNYMQYLAFKQQAQIAQENLKAQRRTLDIVRQQKKVGVAPRLDVERAENQVERTKASVPEFERQAEAARLRLSVLTGLLPENILPLLDEDKHVPEADNVVPVLMAPADVLSLRPDIRAAMAALVAHTDLSEAAVAELFPSFTLGGFFGIEETALASSTHIWSVALGAAVTLLDFGRIEGRVDAARAREYQAYQRLRKTVLQAVSEVETALSSYAYIQEQSVSLSRAQENAQNALAISRRLYKEGEISFLDVLEAQRTANDTDSAVVTAKLARVQALIALYKALGVF